MAEKSTNVVDVQGLTTTKSEEIKRVHKAIMGLFKREDSTCKVEDERLPF